MKKIYEYYYNLSIAYFLPDSKCMFMDKNQYDLLYPSKGTEKDVMVSLKDLERIYGPYMEVEETEDGAVITMNEVTAVVKAGSKEITVNGKAVAMDDPAVKEEVLFLPVASFMTLAFDKYAANSMDAEPFGPRTWNQNKFLLAVCDRYEYKEVPGKYVVEKVERDGFTFDQAAVGLMNRVLNGKDDGELNLSFWYEEAQKVQTYSIYVPTTYDPEIPSKMVIALHGGGLGEQYIYSLSQNQVQFWTERFNYIFVAPNACTKDSTYGNIWDVGGPLAAASSIHDLNSDNPLNLDEEEIQKRRLGEIGILRCIEAVCEKYNIDRDHIFLQGNSMGGLGTFWLGAKYPEIFRAIAPFGIGLDPQLATKYNLAGKPIRMVGGTEDPGWPKIKATYKQFKAAGYDIELDVVGGGVHFDSWAKVLEGTYKFFEKNS